MICHNYNLSEMIQNQYSFYFTQTVSLWLLEQSVDISELCKHASDSILHGWRGMGFPLSQNQ